MIKMNSKRLINSSFAIMIMLTVSKFLGLVRDALIAKNFGLSDIYSFSLGTTMLFVSISYGITAALIPIHTKIKESKDIYDRNVFISNVINIVLFFTLLFVVIGILGAKYIVFLFAKSIVTDINALNETIMLLRIMLLSLIFVAVQSILSAVLQCHKEFLITSSMPVLSNGIYIIYLVVLVNKYGLQGFGIATVLGFFSMLLINIPAFLKLGYRYVWVLNFRDKQIKKMGKSMIPIIICTSLVQINVFIVRAFGGSLEYGFMAALDYANKINMLVYEIFAQAISMVIFPTLSLYISKKDNKAFSDELVRGINLLLMVVIPASVGLLILREPLITVYLQRGEFGERAVLLTSTALIFYIPTMIGYGVRDIINRAYFALNDTSTPMLNSLLNFVINILLCFMLINLLQIRGLALANSLATIITTIFLLLGIKRKIKIISLKKILISFSKILLSSIIMGVIIYFINLYIINFNTSNFGYMSSIILCTAAGTIIYGICIHIAKLEEFNYYINKFRKSN